MLKAITFGDNPVADSDDAKTLARDVKERHDPPPQLFSRSPQRSKSPTSDLAVKVPISDRAVKPPTPDLAVKAPTTPDPTE